MSRGIAKILDIVFSGGYTDGMEGTGLITPTEAAKRKGVSPATIYRAVREKRLPSTEVLGRIGIRPADLDAFEAGSYGGVKRATVRRGPGRRRKEASGEGV